MLDCKNGDSTNGASRFKSSGRLLSVRFKLLVPLMILLSWFFAPAHADEKGWILTQRSASMGDLYTYVSPNGLKWNAPKFGANIATTGPGWNVTMYNDKTKSFYTTTFAEWKKQITKNDTRALQMRSNPWTKGTASSVAGLRATQYVMKVAPGRGAGRPRSVSEAQCWVADDITVPDAIASLLSDTYGMPKTKFFPLRLTYKTADGKAGVGLDTYRSQSSNIPDNYYAAPQGYVAVKSQAEVFMDDETKQLFNDMASEYGLDTAENARPKQPARPAPLASNAALGRRQGMSLHLKDAPPQGNNEAHAQDALGKLLDSFKGK